MRYFGWKMSKHSRFFAFPACMFLGFLRCMRKGCVSLPKPLDSAPASYPERPFPFLSYVTYNAADQLIMVLHELFK